MIRFIHTIFSFWRNNQHKFFALLCCFYSMMFFSHSANAQQSEKIYLSGTGSVATVQWDFMCTAGMNANKWTKIAVPSCWELQGFGKYDYGFAKDSVRGKEQGLYKHRFNAPIAWKGKQINLVFEGVMTDAEVTINGQKAGEIHQGAFYAFKYNVSKLLKYGKENLLEVKVSKHSANASVNAAERQADFWIFGGIFRPVWLEVLPAVHISEVAWRAEADGSFFATLNSNSQQAIHASVQLLDATGKTVVVFEGKNVHPEQPGEMLLTGTLMQPRQWTSETPYLYTAVFSIYQEGKLLHSIRKKVGFRTVELKQRDGIYVNGVKMKFKGVNRHAFRPETGRTTSYRISVEDVQLIKSMNMNAVRMSHYPPDDHFLDVCDSLGLFVMDELAGWHGHYDTPTGKKLLKEMMLHDAHHPSIVLWANGNEGGHNRELDGYFTQYDLQQRPVVHPWELYNGVETQHYREYNYGIGNYDNGNEIVMPTEFLHGQFDGGHGAGLEDYWQHMWHNPLSAGGFLWDFADNAVVRRDKNDSLDTDKHRAADGIVGPHHEKEGSYFAIKQIWSPVFIERREITPDFDGSFTVENRYHFTNLNTCQLRWKLKRIDVRSTNEVNGTAPMPDAAPLNKAMLQLNLPANWMEYDVLYLSITDAQQQELFTWTYPIHQPAAIGSRMRSIKGPHAIQLQEQDSLLQVRVSDVTIQFNKYNGIMQSVSNGKGVLPLHNGPVLQDAVNNLGALQVTASGDSVVLQTQYNKQSHYNNISWTIYPSGWVKLQVQYFPSAYFTNFAGINFSFPEKEIQSVTYMGDGPYRVWKNRMKGNQFGVWSKTYNNAETGESPWLYPEFKGYHSRFYGGYFFSKNNRFTVVCETENIFLRLFTPAWKTDQWHNYEPLFPSGDISFMHGISSIGTKTQRNETTGPMGFKNIFYDYEKDPARALHMTLFFNFSAQ